ncbi:MAG: hypothetical protein KAI17_25335, partial [Thiotrichaceae bacterium]|nr:hypothetical protein [Thiotrichaceae bacterium]
MTIFIEKQIDRKTRLRKAHKKIFGIGINDADYYVYLMNNNKIIGVCPYYEKWKSMLKRCYSNTWKASHPTYQNCSACDDWLLFSNFKYWMKRQDWENKELD